MPSSTASTTLHSDTSMEVPRCLTCPITGKLMADPVTDREGYTYERDAITAWLASHGTSPVTRNRLAVADLAPNRGIRDAADDWYWLHSRGSPAVVALAMTASETEENATNALKVTLTVAPCDDLCAMENDATLMVTLTPPIDAETSSSGGGNERLPCDLVCVIDVSGSMGDEAVAKDAAGTTERTGLTMLDVVKHAVLAVAELLGPQDRLALVPFSTNATAGKFRNMDTAGREAMQKELMSFKPSGSTNLWSGIVEGMSIASRSTRNCSVFVLTDGQPTSIPDGGYVEAMKRHVKENRPAFTLSTFGFGYNIETATLTGIAEEGRGTFAFIPDSGLVGTIFVNAAANLLTTWATFVRVTIEVPREMQPAEALLPNGVAFDEIGSTLTADLGTMQYGQSRHLTTRLVRRMRGGSASRGSTKFAAKAVVCVGGDLRDVPAEVIAQESIPASMQVQLARAAFVGTIGAAMGSSEKLIAKLRDEIAARRDSAPIESNSRTKALFDGLLEDLATEITMGAEPDNFRRWGVHYYRSIAAANNREQCNNFKDKSVQCFGGKLFVRLQADGERAFLALPPPVGTFTANGGYSGYATGGSTAGAASPAQPVNMNWAYNCSGGCVAPSAMVMLASGAEKPACEVRKDDVLAGGFAVECVVRVRVPHGKMNFARLRGGLLVSPYHPVRIAGAWHFPVNAPTLETYPVPTMAENMYSFTLAQSGGDPKSMPCVRTDGVDVAPIAHACGEGIPVIGHAFFGGGGSAAALKASPGYASGVVEVSEFTRDAGSKMIVGMVVA